MHKHVLLFLIVLFYFICTACTNDAAMHVALTVVLMAILWVTGVVPLWVTAVFVPLIAYPLFDVYGTGAWGAAATTANAYTNPFLRLFFGGMVVGRAMEVTKLHERLALGIMSTIGATPDRLLFGMLVAVALLSGFISNTAAAVMMVNIAVALVKRLDLALRNRFATAMLMSIATGANIGGILTIIGTPPNAILVDTLDSRLDWQIGFLSFVVLTAPFVASFLGLAFLILRRFGLPDRPETLSSTFIATERGKLGAMSLAERKVAFVFGAMGILWMTSSFIWMPLLGDYLPVGTKGKHFDAWVGVVGACVVVVSGAMQLREISRIGWGVIGLLGGSFAMAAGVQGSGLSEVIGSELAVLGNWSSFGQILAVSTTSVTLSSFASNTATMTLLAAVLPATNAMLFAAAFGVSANFALPAGTPPNVCVAGTAYVTAREMAVVGTILSITGVALMTAYLWSLVVFGVL